MDRIPLKKQKLEVFGVIKEALSILNTYSNFFIFTLIVSLPLFCFLIYYESFLLNILFQISEAILTLPREDYYVRYFYHWPLGTLDRHFSRSLNKEFAFKLCQLALLYVLPLHLLEFFTTLITVDVASMIHTTQERIETLKEMLDTPIYKAKLKTTFITSACVLFLSTSTLLGLIWLVINYFVFWKNFYDVLFAVVYGAAFLALLLKYLEWSAQWNMSVVISILEDVHGVEALALSAYFNRGSEKRGMLLSLVFLVWGLVLRLPCLFFGCYDYDRGNGIVVEVFLYCLGNVIKWVAFMVYYYDSKQRILEKKVDEEVGIVVKAVDG